MPNQSKIVTCSCEHSFQDSQYGPGRRVANYALKCDKYVCTVCGKQHGTGGSPPKKKDGKK